MYLIRHCVCCTDNKTSHGDMYLRKCDSIAYAQGTLRKTMRVHGTNGATLNLANCNNDGSYGYYRLEGNLWVSLSVKRLDIHYKYFRAFCQLPDGKKLLHSAPARDLREMNCSKFTWGFQFTNFNNQLPI